MTKQELVEKLANCQICYAQFGKCKLYDRTTCSDYKEALYIYRKQKEIVKEFENGTLSERKICKNVTKQHPVDEFICSECGLILEGYHKKRIDNDGDEIYYEYEIKYCPSCGAKVVEE